MPSVSKSQRRLFGLAEHHPGLLYKKNASLGKLSHAQIHDFADTKEAGLPERKGSMISARRKK